MRIINLNEDSWFRGKDLYFSDGPTSMRFSLNSDIVGDVIIEIYENGKLINGLGITDFQFKDQMLKFLKSI